MSTTGQAINYSAGRNIAIKVPDHEYRQTVHFYHNILGFATHRIARRLHKIQHWFSAKTLFGLIVQIPSANPGYGWK